MSTQRDPIRISITDPVLIRVAALAEQRGVDAYVVGGYVRDALMGRPRTDIDITVVGDPIELNTRHTAQQWFQCATIT